MNILIIFDLDGTLADTREDLAFAVNMVRKSYKLSSLPQERIIGYVGGGRNELMKKAMADAPEIDLAESCDRFTKYYSENLVVNTCLYEGVADVISGFAEKGYYMAVLSNKPGNMCREITAHFKLDNFLVSTIGGEDLSEKKPAPSGIFSIISLAEQKGFQKGNDNVWMVGDHHTDLMVAQNASIKSVFCNYGFGDRQGLPSDFSIDSFRELEDIIR